MAAPRSLWNDRAIDVLKERVDDIAGELIPLKELPAAVARVAVKVDGLAETTREMREAHVRAEKQEVRRVTALHRRFDQQDQDHKAVIDGLRNHSTPQKGRWAWRDVFAVIAVISSITVPLAAAYIGVAS
jgi:hypothetical protein